MAIEGPLVVDPCQITREENLVFKEDFEAFLEDQYKLFAMSCGGSSPGLAQGLTPPERFQAAMQTSQTPMPEVAKISKLHKVRDEEESLADGCRPARASSSTTASTTTGRASSATSASGSSLSLPVRQSTETAVVQQRSAAGSERLSPLLAVVEPLSESSDGEAEQLASVKNARAPHVALAAKGRGSPANPTSTSGDASTDKCDASSSTAIRRHWMLGCTGSGGVEAECTATMHEDMGNETPSTCSPPSTAGCHSTNSDVTMDVVSPTPPLGPPTCPQPPSPHKVAAQPAASRRKHWMLGASRDQAS